MVLQMVEAGHAEDREFLNWLIEDGLGRKFEDNFVEG